MVGCQVVEDFVKQDVILSRYYDEAKVGTINIDIRIIFLCIYAHIYGQLRDSKSLPSI